VQGRALDGGPEPAKIIRHPDVRRMLATMKARTEAARALAYWAAAALDRSKAAPDEKVRAAAQARLDLLIPVVKSWCTDIACEVASLGVQVHGGMGFIEETGAAQHYRDARILPIYEGTNGIQALDLLGRKLLRDRGAAMTDLIAELRGGLPELPELRGPLAEAVEILEATTVWLLDAGEDSLPKGAAGATPYLNLCGTVIGAWLLARSAAAQDGGTAPAETRLKTARFYADNLLGEATGLARAVTRGAETTLAFADGDF
jgi:hypothetical protein